jgi:hypothetical protein
MDSKTLTRYNKELLLSLQVKSFQKLIYLEYHQQVGPLIAMVRG